MQVFHYIPYCTVLQVLVLLLEGILQSTLSKYFYHDVVLSHLPILAMWLLANSPLHFEAPPEEMIWLEVMYRKSLLRERWHPWWCMFVEWWGRSIHTLSDAEHIPRRDSGLHMDPTWFVGFYGDERRQRIQRSGEGALTQWVKMYGSRESARESENVGLWKAFYWVNIRLWQLHHPNAEKAHVLQSTMLVPYLRYVDFSSRQCRFVKESGNMRFHEWGHGVGSKPESLYWRIHLHCRYGGP